MLLDEIVLGSRKGEAEDDNQESFVPQGVCSKLIRYTVEDGKLHNVRFTGGCDGNLQGIGRLVEGMPVDDVIGRLGGICCGKKNTSCPDQFSRALKQYKQK